MDTNKLKFAQTENVYSIAGADTEAAIGLLPEPSEYEAQGLSEEGSAFLNEIRPPEQTSPSIEQDVGGPSFGPSSRH